MSSYAHQTDSAHTWAHSDRDGLSAEVNQSVAKTRAAATTALVFLASAITFIAFRSKDMCGVDGAFRCLEVYRRGVLFFHENNHMLYPVNVLLWSRIASAIMSTPHTPEAFFAMVQLMNCLAGAACLAMVFYLTQLATSTGLALGVAAVYGLTRAFLLHSTNSAEVMVGVLWSFLALCCAALALKYATSWPLVGSALLFSLGMATYQSTILLAPAAIVLFSFGRLKAEGGTIWSWPRARDAALFVCSGFAGCLVIFSLVYWYQGVLTPVGMLKAFFVHRDERAYLGVGAAKSLSLAIGLARNLFPVLPDFTGIRHLIAGPKPTLLWFLLLLFALGGLLSYCVFRLVKGWKKLDAAAQIGVLVAATGLTLTTVPLVIWDPEYDKLWIQPLAFLAFLVAVALGVVKLPGDSRFVLSAVIPSAVFAGLLFNAGGAVRDHFREQTDLREVKRLATLIGEHDLLVGDWDRISTIYGYGWAKDNHFVSFPSEAVLFGPDSVSRLREAVLNTHSSGGQVYFLAILDEPKATWEPFLAAKCGVPFSAMDVYRKRSVVRDTIYSNSGRVPLRQLELGN